MEESNYPDAISAEQSAIDTVSNMDGFFATPKGLPTIATGGDLEASIPVEEREDLVELDRYWAAYPYSYVSVCRSKENNEVRYFVVEPYLSDPEADLIAFLMEKLEHSLRNDAGTILDEDSQVQRSDVRRRVFTLLSRYDLFDPAPLEAAHMSTGKSLYGPQSNGLLSRLTALVSDSSEPSIPEFEYHGPTALDYGGLETDGYLPVVDHIAGHPAYRSKASEESEPDVDADVSDLPLSDSDVSQSQSGEEAAPDGGVAKVPENSPDQDELSGAPETAFSSSGQSDGLSGDDVRSMALSDADDAALNEYHVYKILYYLERELLGYGQIDAIKNDQSIEDISSNGYNEPVFVYHAQHEQIRTNVVHGEEELDRFVKSLAQFAGKEVSRRSPEADAKIPDGSRAQLTLGKEVSEDGTNYTIRQFKDVPFTPVDLLNWGTYGVDPLAVLWLAIESEMSVLVAGGTGAGKTTTLNALSLFIPSRNKVVSIEDTQEIKLPHRNWTRKTTREAGDQMDDSASITEYDLLESALRMRPDQIVMGEVRGSEGQDLLQGMSTGHSGITTFHANSVDKVVHRFTTDPISAAKPLFASLDLICVQTETQVDGTRVRRATNLSEVNGYDTDTDSIDIDTLYEWTPQEDGYVSKKSTPGILANIQQQKGWSDDQLQAELMKRKAVLTYLSLNGISDYQDVAAVIQAFIQDQETILTHIADGTLENNLHKLRRLGNIDIETTASAEKSINRPEPSDELANKLDDILTECITEVF